MAIDHKAVAAAAAAFLDSTAKLVELPNQYYCNITRTHIYIYETYSAIAYSAAEEMAGAGDCTECLWSVVRTLMASSQREAGTVVAVLS